MIRLRTTNPGSALPGDPAEDLSAAPEAAARREEDRMAEAANAAWSGGTSTLFNLVSVGALVLGAVIYFARLDPAIGELDRKVGDVKATQIEAASRIDRLDESRTLDVQRLAKSEEAVTAIKDVLTRIDAKVDRLLTRGH